MPTVFEILDFNARLPKHYLLADLRNNREHLEILLKFRRPRVGKHLDFPSYSFQIQLLNLSSYEEIEKTGRSELQYICV